MAKEQKSSTTKKKGYIENLKMAYYLGYKKGYEDSTQYPKAKGSLMVVSIGYRHGARDKRKQNKINNKLSNKYAYKS